MSLTKTLQLFALFFACILSLPCLGFDSLTESSIRDAYFLGSRPGGVSPEILGRYARQIDELHQGNCVSKARIETPFLQIAEEVASRPNYSAQDAVKEFSGRPTSLRVFLDICYMSEAPAPHSVKLRFFQNTKEVLSTTDNRSAFAERFNKTSFLPPNGESAKLEFDPKNLDSSALTILIDTPNGQHAETIFDLQSLR
jgi:hypothetical protein